MHHCSLEKIDLFEILTIITSNIVPLLNLLKTDKMVSFYKGVLSLNEILQEKQNRWLDYLTR